tara:strand:+ start:37 stop:357 length:321 start_codon:yes stop_codon:yes gene_type:complete
MTENDKMLIFKNADDDTAMLPLSRLHQIDGGTGSIVLTFGGSQTDDDLVDTDVDVITLTTGADEFEACKELVRKFNEGPNSDGALVVADDIAGVYCSSTITGVAIA